MTYNVFGATLSLTQSINLNQVESMRLFSRALVGAERVFILRISDDS